jgi:HK97 family phage prohead protease
MEQNKMDKILQKIDSGREYRRMEIRAKEVDDQTKEECKVDGYASTFNEPYELWTFDGYTVREQIDPHAFDECDMSDVIMQYDHQGRVFARNSNGTLQIKTDEHGLYMEADLSGTEIGRQLFEEIKGGYTTKMSFGFTVDEDKREITENVADGAVDVLRTITKIRKLYDVSAVSLPANDGTEISARSYSDGVIAELEAERLQRKAKEEARAKALAALNKYHKEVSND